MMVKKQKFQQLKSEEQVVLFSRHKKQYNKNNGGKENKTLQVATNHISRTSCDFQGNGPL